MFSRGQPRHTVSPPPGSDVAENIRCLLQNLAESNDLDLEKLISFVNHREIRALATEFFADTEHLSDKPHLVANHFFWDLQSILHEDKQASDWYSRGAKKKEWRISDHLIRYILRSDRMLQRFGKVHGWPLKSEFKATVLFHLDVLWAIHLRDTMNQDVTKG
jgi:hypothetical protein